MINVPPMTEKPTLHWGALLNDELVVHHLPAVDADAGDGTWKPWRATLDDDSYSGTTFFDVADAETNIDALRIALEHWEGDGPGVSDGELNVRVAQFAAVNARVSIGFFAPRDEARAQDSAVLLGRDLALGAPFDLDSHDSGGDPSAWWTASYHVGILAPSHRVSRVLDLWLKPIAGTSSVMWHGQDVLTESSFRPVTPPAFEVAARPATL